jgi:adenosine deaminase
MIDPTFPLIDLHRHLDGCVRLQTILDMGREHNLPLPASDIDGLRPHVQITEPKPGLLAYFSKFKWMIGVLVDYDACRRIAFENVEDAHHEGIDYVELRFSPWFMAEPHGLDPEGVVDAVIDGVQAGMRDFDISVNLIGIMSRTYGPDIAWKELESLLAHRDHLVALDLAGDEANWPGDLFVEHFKRGRDAGWQITVHAGESAGAANIWQAIDELGATRIGHAVRAVDDSILMDRMAEDQIGIEANLTSNVQTSIIPDYSGSPVRMYLEKGLLATLNTDNTGIGAIDLHHEFNVAAPAAGLDTELAAQAQRNALEVAFLSLREKKSLVAKKQASSPT